MKEHITSLISETDLQNDFVRDIRERYIDQKFLYTTQAGAEGHYHSTDENRDQEQAKRYSSLFPRDYFDKNERFAFISLGCGNSSIEKSALQALHAEGFNFMYIGVDISGEMLKLAQKELEDIAIEKRFIEADILANDFKDALRNSLEGVSKCLFVLVGGTICNMNQTDIADCLYNLLLPEDLLWVEFPIRKDNTMESELKFFNRYTEYLSGPNSQFIFQPLKQIGVPYGSGSLILKSDNDATAGSLRFRFFFRFNQKVTIDLDGERIHFLPNEEIKLLTIRIYHPETFIKFLAGHEFKLIFEHRVPVNEPLDSHCLFRKLSHAEKTEAAQKASMAAK